MAHPMQMPPMMPRNTLEPKVALSLAGADSAVYTALATSSPPTLKPWASVGYRSVCFRYFRWDLLGVLGLFLGGRGYLQGSADEEEEGRPCANVVVFGSEGDGEARHSHQKNGPHERCT